MKAMTSKGGVTVCLFAFGGGFNRATAGARSPPHSQDPELGQSSPLFNPLPCSSPDFMAAFLLLDPS